MDSLDSDTSKIEHIGNDGYMSEGIGFVNVFPQTKYTDLSIISNDSDGHDAGVFHISLYLLTHYSGSWKTHFDDISDDPLEYVIKLDYPAWLVAAWLDSWHINAMHIIDPHYEYIEYLMPMYLKYDMAHQLVVCYNKFKTLEDYTIGLIKLIFSVNQFKPLEQYFIDNILLNQNFTIPIEWLQIIPIEIIYSVIKQKNEMLCVLNNNFN